MIHLENPKGDNSTLYIFKLYRNAHTFIHTTKCLNEFVIFNAA